MQVISTDINVPLNVLDVDVLAGATQRSNVYAAVEGTKACTVEMRVTLLGAQPVNLALRVLGQLSAPAADPTTLLPLGVAVPDTSALAANYTRIFVLPVFTPFNQLEVTNVSGGNVHVQLLVQGCDAEFVDAAAAAASVGHVIVDTLPALVAGTAAIGKVDVAVYAPWIDTVASADTSAHVYGYATSLSQVVKAPVFVHTPDTLTGIVTISDGTRPGMTLIKNQSAPFYVTNLNQLTYQFSVNAGTEKFSISAGV